MDCDGKKDIFIALDLYQISEALSFVHNSLRYIHCLVSPSSIFINKAGDFKLGSFELAHQYKNIPSHFLSNFDLLPTKYRAKEFMIDTRYVNRKYYQFNTFITAWIWFKSCYFIMFEKYHHYLLMMEMRNYKKSDLLLLICLKIMNVARE